MSEIRSRLKQLMRFAPSGKSAAWLKLNLAICLFGLSAIIATQITVSPTMIVWGRCLFSCLALLAFQAARGGDWAWRGRNAAQLGKLALSGAILAVHWISFFVGVAYGGVAPVTLGFASFPAFVIAFNAIIEKRLPSVRDILVIILILIGLVLVTPSFDLGNSATAGLFWGMVSGILYAGIILANRVLAKGVPALASCWWQYLTVFILLLPAVSGQIPSVALRDWLWILLAGLLCTALAYTIFFSALPQVRPTEAAVISATEPAYALVLAWVFLGDIPTLKMVAGGLLIVMTVIWSALKSH